VDIAAPWADEQLSRSSASLGLSGGLVPLPAVAALSLPGLALPCAISLQRQAGRSAHRSRFDRQSERRAESDKVGLATDADLVEQS
jgi:hypothetical protein